ncbi:MAG: hypothetical protein U1E49_20740 [Hyphomicrobiaceae bacterium]
MSELTTVDKDRRRDELFEELSMGRLTPEAAERIAREEGLEPLQHVPGPTEFDPENEAWWTLPMVVAWIVWRTIDRVRSQFDPYRAAAPYWRTKLVRHLVTQEVVSEDGWWLDYAKPASTLGLVLCEAWEKYQVETGWRKTTVLKALPDFSAKASMGRVRTVGMSVADVRVVEIPSFEWCYLQIGEAKDRDEIRYEHDHSAQYTLVRVLRKDVMKCWRRSEASSDARRDAYQRCKDWLLEEMRAHPGEPTWTKKAATKIAKQKFGVARDGFFVIWSESAVTAGALAWTYPGRRPKKRTAGIRPKK